jgi:hypothetical protein
MQRPVPRRRLRRSTGREQLVLERGRREDAATLAPSLPDVSWTRFWIPRDGSLHLDPDDYLADPEGEHGSFRNPSAQTLEALSERPCLALLGEPGIGKSRTLRAHLDRVRDPWSQDGDLLSFNLADGYNLEQEIGGAPEFQRWLCGQTTLHLFLDSLDEHHDGGAAKVAAWLLRKLDRGPVLRLRLRLACRTADWPRALDERLSGYWKGKDDLGFYELAPLRRKDVELAAGPDASSFLQEVERRHAVALAIKPITLRFLLDEFQRNRVLPAQRWELYQRGCRLLCSEESRSRHDVHQTGKLDAEKRLAVAARIAAVTMFCHRPLIWHGRGDTPPDSVLEREMCGGSEQAPTGEVNVSAGEVAEALASTGMFTARADKGLGWAHQTYAEFLAAWFLKNRGLSVDEMLQAVTNPGTPGKVVPELHEVAAWLAGMSSEFFAALAHSDPEVLLRSDFAKVGEADREMLVGILLEMLDKKETLDDRLWERKTSRRLEHPKLATQLRPYIVDREKYFMARRAAITIAESCTTADLQDDLATVALDAGDDPHLRARAAHAVVRIGDRATKRRLRPLAFEQCGPDPQDDLKGYAMEALWREDLTTEEVFANLLAPKQPNYYGAYQTFVSHHLPMRLRSSDLPRALSWTATLPAQHTDTSVHTFNTFMAEVLKRAWGQLDEPTILSAFAVAARARLTCHESVFGGHHGNDTSDAEFRLSFRFGGSAAAREPVAS